MRILVLSCQDFPVSHEKSNMYHPILERTQNFPYHLSLQIGYLDLTYIVLLKMTEVSQQSTPGQQNCHPEEYAAKIVKLLRNLQYRYTG